MQKEWHWDGRQRLGVQSAELRTHQPADLRLLQSFYYKLRHGKRTILRGRIESSHLSLSALQVTLFCNQFARRKQQLNLD